MKKNVLQLIGSFHQGGSERQAVQLTRLLHQDQTVNVFPAALNREGVLLREVEKLGFTAIPEFKLTSFFDLNFVRQVRKCVKFIRENNIEIVHTHDFYTNIFGMLAAFIARVPARIASKRETGGMRTASQKFVENLAFKLSRSIVVNSEAVKDHLTGSGISSEKIEVIYNGIDLERLKPEISDRKKICEMLGLPSAEDVKFVTLVANLRHEVKNQPMFLRAAKIILEDFANAHFVIAGEGELREKLEDLAVELGIFEQVSFLGRCGYVPELLHISDICTLTSFAEGFSNSILEYMAAAKPVVATDVGGAKEAIVHGETGFLVDSDDDRTLAEYCLDLLNSKEKSQKFGRKGRALAKEKFSVEAQLQNTLKLYKTV